MKVDEDKIFELMRDEVIRVAGMLPEQRSEEEDWFLSLVEQVHWAFENDREFFHRCVDLLDIYLSGDKKGALKTFCAMVQKNLGGDQS